MIDRMRFTKGHGTGNDFVILADPDGQLDLTPGLVAALCHRRFGIGADGVLRVVRAAKHPEAVDRAGEAEWFMDYWNADGSIAEMCGNGVRVFTRYLVTSGFAVAPAEGPGLPILTRAGLVRARVGADTISVDMGLPRRLGASTATVGGWSLPGTAVDCGNPHLVCPLPLDLPLAGLDLSRQPGFDPAMFPAGVNVEFMTPGEPREPHHSAESSESSEPWAEATGPYVRMRVFERGSGETLSCGTGACAVASVALAETGSDRGVVTVDLPGGRLTATFDGRTCWLAGPAVLIATGEVDLQALRAAG